MAAACAEKFQRQNVGVSLTVTPCWCYRRGPRLPSQRLARLRHRQPRSRRLPRLPKLRPALRQAVSGKAKPTRSAIQNPKSKNKCSSVICSKCHSCSPGPEPRPARYSEMWLGQSVPACLGVAQRRRARHRDNLPRSPGKPHTPAAKFQLLPLDNHRQDSLEILPPKPVDISTRRKKSCRVNGLRAIFLSCSSTDITAAGHTNKS